YIAYQKAGPALIIAYVLASILILPSVLSKAELATAMPKAGGTYFFVERSLGSFCGLFTGFANWFGLALKSAFAVVGMAVFVQVLVHYLFGITMTEVHLKEIAVLCCLGFTALNIVSVKHTSRFQVLLVGILLTILALYVFLGAGAVQPVRYSRFLEEGWLAVLATAGLVFISYGGLTKVASVAEEIKNPGRNLPLGMILAWFVVSLLYVAVVVITVGVLSGPELGATLTPISLAASKFMPLTGFALLAVAAVAAFVTTANGGILAASRYPMAMSRDQLLPPILARLNSRFKTPHISIILTGGFMTAAIVLLDMERLVKSRIQSYRPRFKSPLYPYPHIFAIVAYSFLIIDMGKVPLLITAAFVVASAAWYWLYVSKRVSRASAAMHIVERVTDRQLKTVTLENELRDILIERDQIIEDRFDKLIKQCEILDIKGRVSFDDAFRRVSKILEKRLDISEYVLFEQFLQREEAGATVVQPGLAIPHIVIEGQAKFDVVLVRAVDGIDFPKAPDPVKIMFVLAGTKDERNYHLRALMAIAQIAQEKNFEQRWLAARDTAAIRNLILLSKRKRDATA
ncbi:MAG: amino acid permease, partial [Planctomycetota bacterium]